MPSLSFTSASSSSHLSQGFKTLFAREFVTTPAFTTTCYADRLPLSLTSNTTSLRTAISKTIKVYLSLDPALGTGQVYPAPNKAWHSSPPPQYRQALWNNLVARGASQRVVLSPEVDKLVRTSMESRLEWGFLPFSCSLESGEGESRVSRLFRLSFRDVCLSLSCVMVLFINGKRVFLNIFIASLGFRLLWMFVETGSSRVPRVCGLKRKMRICLLSNEKGKKKFGK